MLTHLLAFFLIRYGYSQATMGIDMGSQYIKAIIMTPSKPFETVLDRESNRKTLALVGFKEGQPVFSEAAKNLCRRFPEDVVPNVFGLLGRRFDDISIQEYRKKNPYLNITKNETNGGILVNFNKYNFTFTPIELYSLILSEIHDFTISFSSRVITEIVLSFDPTIDQARAEAVKSATVLSGYNLLEIVDSSQAVTTQFILTRKNFLPFSPKFVMIVDVGALNTVATVAQVGLEAGSKPNTTIGSYNITGIGYARVGASDFDECLKDFFLDDFTKKHNLSGIPTSHRVVYKFLEQISRAKHVLTSSKDVSFVVENAYDYQTYKTVLTREIFEEKCSYIVKKMGEAIIHAFDSSKPTLDQLGETVVMGGGSRIPAVQQLIESMTGHGISRVLNTDEANAAGASFLAAKAHKLFRVAEIKSDAVLYYPIEGEYRVRMIDSEGNVTVQHQKTLLYKFLDLQKRKKVLTMVNVTDDFTIRLRYGQFFEYLSTENLDCHDLMDIHVSGVKEAIINNPNAIPRCLAIHFSIDQLRSIRPHKIEYVFERNGTSGIFGRVGQAVMNLLNINSNSNSTEQIGTDESNVITANQTTLLSNNTVSDEQKPIPPQERNISVPLPFTVTILYFPPPTEDELSYSAQKLKELYAHQRAKLEDAVARGDLEEAIFRAERSISDEQLRSFFTDEEHQNLTELHARLSEEFSVDGHLFNSSISRIKLREVNSATDKARKRVNNRKDIENHVEVLQQLINRTQSLVTNSFENPELSKFVNASLALNLLNLTFETNNWLNEKLENFSALAPTDKPHLSATQLKRKIKALEESESLLYKSFQEMLNLMNALSKVEKKNNETHKQNTTDASETVPTPTELPPDDTTSSKEQPELKEDPNKVDL